MKTMTRAGLVAFAPLITAYWPSENPAMSRMKVHLHAHLDTVNESYFQHMQHALSFTVAMFFGALCCLVHAFIPFLFERKGSAIVQQLHDRMVVNRDKLTSRQAHASQADNGLAESDPV